MAEQEACTELVEKASREDHHHRQRDVGSLEGESSNLLPLLQGLLEAPDSEHHADSGIESGEDQRTGLIAEVQLALDKLSASLRSDAADIVPERRSSLLQLVAKLQAGLSTTTAIPPKLERRLSGGAGRFASKRRERHSRHTVGVSSEELADARRLIEEISLGDVASSSKTKLDLRKQNSESSVTSNSSSFNKFTPCRTAIAVKNATARPFNSSSNSVSNASSSSLAQTPTDTASEHLDFLFGDETGHHKTPPLPHVIDKKPDETVPTSPMISVHQAVQAAARKKVNPGSVESETEEEDASTVKEHNTIDKTPSPNLLQDNPIYAKPPEKSESSNSLSYEEKVNRFNTQTKKLKMKRANTIDIPKSLKYYEDQDDSDSDEDEAQKRKNTYYALRGPIRVNTPVHKTNVPVFEPKTKTDQKFLHFLHKNQENPPTNRPTSMWSHQTNKTPVWGSKFGNIKTNFESGEKSAKNFWKTQDDAVGVVGSQFGPRISKQSARNLQQMFEEKQKQTNVVTGSLTVKTEPERAYKFVPQPLPVNKFSHAPQSAFKPLPKKSPENPEILKKELNEKPDETPLFLYSPKPMFNSQESSASTSPITSKPWVSNAIEHGGRVLSMVAKKFEAPHHEEPHHIKPRKLSKEYQRVFAPKETPAEKLSAPYLVKSAEKTGNTVRKLSQEYDKVPTPQNYSVTTTVKYQPVQDTRHHYVPPFKKPQSFTTPKSNYHFKEPERIQPAPQSPYGGHSPKKIYNQKEPPFHHQQQFQPVNYSIRYDQPGVVHNTPPPSQPLPTDQVYHPSKPEPHYTTRMQFSIKPEAEAPKFSVKSEPHIPSNKVEVKSEPEIRLNVKSEPPPPPRISVKPEPELPKLQTQVSSDGLHEYNAISSKVMVGPVSQQAVTVRQKSPMSRNEHDMEAALNLKNSLQQLGRRDSSKSPSNHKYNTPPASPQNSFKYKSEPIKEPIRIEVKPTVAQMDNKTYGVVKPFQQTQQKPTPIYNNVNRKLRQESSETNEKGQNVVYSKFHIPVINVAPGTPPAHAKMLSKSDSWHQICMANKPAAPVKSTQNPVLKSKSSHSLAVPQKQFEAGMSKDELVQKRRTIEAYFSTGKSPVKRSINRIKTSEKVSASSQSMSSLSRSRTLPDIVCPDLLDESNPDKAFEDLFKAAA